VEKLESVVKLGSVEKLESVVKLELLESVVKLG